MWVMGEWSVVQWIVGVISFQKMYGLYGLKHHTVEIRFTICFLYFTSISSRPTQKQFKLKQKDSNPQTDSPEWPFRCFKDKKVAENFFHLGGSRIYPS